MIVVLDSSTLRVSWRTIPTQYRNGFVHHYIIRVTAIATGVALELKDSSSPVLVSSLHPYSNYSIEVAAFTVELGPYSTAKLVQTAEDRKLWYTFSTCSMASVYCKSRF